VSFRFSSTFNTWYLDDVKIFCTPCTPPSVIPMANPSSGPAGTLVTISGTGFTGSTTVKFKTANLPIISQTATQLVVQIPNNATDGNLVVNTPSTCSTAIACDVINNDQSSCQSTIDATDLFIYEVFDEDNDVDNPVDYGNGGMLTIFNGTFNTVNLSDYRLYRTTNYSNTGTYPYQTWFSPSGTLAPGEVYRIYVSASVCTSYQTPYDTVAVGFNADDGIELRKFNTSTSSYVTIDQVHTPNAPGYLMVRDLSASPLPNPSYNNADWSIDTLNSFSCQAVGSAPPFEGSVPTIDSLLIPASVCDSATLTVNASE